MRQKQALNSERYQRNTAIALFRYGLIAPLLFTPPAPGELEAALREIASQRYQIPHSRRQRVSVSTLRRYLTWYQKGGFEALYPQSRCDKGGVKAFPAQVLETAIALRQEQPARTTPMLVELLHRHPDLELEAPINVHTLATHLRRAGKTRQLLRQAGRSYQRFEREHSNSLWQGDAMVGPWLPDPIVPGRQRRSHLFCFLDDHSRLIPHAEFFWDEKLPRLERVLKVALLRRGVPQAIYVDNGAVYAANQLETACAALGIRRLRTAPYSPESKGKQERFFETVRLQFMPEVATAGLATLAELNDSFWAWLDCIYHQNPHSATGQTPLDRFRTGLLPHPAQVEPARLTNAFLWREPRKVRKDGTLSLQGNQYQVGAHLAGRTLDLHFDPFDLSVLEIYLDEQHLGRAVVVKQGRQLHLAVQGMIFDPPEPATPPSTVDYLAVLRAEHRQMLAKEAGSIHFAALLPPPPNSVDNSSPHEGA